ncbi:MAG: TetR/AcrR family transcriptional regulator [Eubacteriales bacterium]|nr:TetR/AcrR family transcriptional regulator [Eubacteriales bacterium]
MNTDTNEKKSYHFGNLKEALIEQGIELIHEEGVEKFSLRKVAKKVGVSATACYNHFGNIDELLQGMNSYVIDKFSTALKQAAEDNPCQCVAISMGVAYVEFFAKNPHYFNFLFDSEYLDIQIKESEITWNESFTPFQLFVDGAKSGMRERNIDEKELRDDLLVMWATVHGLAAMANMKGVRYENGDWGALTERILTDKVML